MSVVFGPYFSKFGRNKAYITLLGFGVWGYWTNKNISSNNPKTF